MSENYSFSSIIYDPLLYLPLRPIRRKILKKLSPHKNKKIIDLCCGTGNQLKILAKNNFTSLNGLDSSQPMLRVAKSGNHQINYFQKDATKTGFKKETFDIVIISFAIHEKDYKTEKSMIREVCRILKKRGTLIIADFIFDKKTTKIAKMGIHTIEKMAGKEHYANFKSYLKNGGLIPLIKNKFKLKEDNRKLFGGVTISLFTKK